MCQLLGMNCNSAAAINFSFTGFAERGGRTADHVDGWGIAFYERSGCRVFHDDQPASQSPLATFVREYPIKSRIVVAHIRKATQGEVSLANCHPFQREWLGQNWIFANNGDLKNFYPELGDGFLPVGNTDSERAFCHLMQTLKQRFGARPRPPTWQELAPEIAQVAASIARYGNFNFLLSNGEALFSHCSSKLYALERRHPFPTAQLVDCDMSLDLGALNQVDDRMAIVATEPLTIEESWCEYETGESKVFIQGQEVWRHVSPNTQRFEVQCAYVGRAWPANMAPNGVETAATVGSAPATGSAAIR
jgi:predicted glutamine amidotransferase